MKLNNKGWTTNEMVEMILILFVLLLFVAISIYQLYNTLEDSQTVEISELERNIANAARNYYYDFGYSEDMIITYTLLRSEGYIDSFYKTYGVDCDGYVVKNKVFTGYVKCKNAQSEGYNNNYD